MCEFVTDARPADAADADADDDADEDASPG